MRLFGRKKEIEEEMEDLDKLATGPETTNVVELPPELTRLKETAEAEAEKITERLEEPKEMLPEPVEVRREFELDELPLKDLNERIEEELKDVRKRLKGLGSLTKLSLDSPEMISLMDLYTEYSDKLNRFIEELDRINLTALSSNKTFAAIYKFKACKGLSEIKKEIRRIEAVCKKAGFMPAKVHKILESKAEDLIDEILQLKSKN